jgi:cation diffusion facilitator family transporter
MKHRSLTHYAWISILCAVTTIGLKTIAFLLTGSVGLLSDAIESIVNLIAAVMALFMLRLSEKPPDDDHMFGHSKAEYFSSIVEGILIIIAAASISFSAITRFLHPQQIDFNLIGISVSILASGINLFVALHLLNAGKKYHSITLEADAHHLLTDVWTSVGVLVAIGLIFITSWQILDPLIACIVAGNIVISGIRLMYRSVQGFMDTTISKEDTSIIISILTHHCGNTTKYHDIRTRQAGTRRFVSFHILVPGKWTIQQGHNLAEDIEKDIRKALPNTTVTTHIEPMEDPRSWNDTTLDREDEKG